MICANAQSLAVRTFRVGTDKEAARKPSEEAVEVYAAWELMGREEADQHSSQFDKTLAVMGLADELADCITACCNLAARYDLDLQAALDRVEQRNRERGRYEQA